MQEKRLRYCPNLNHGASHKLARSARIGRYFACYCAGFEPLTNVKPLDGVKKLSSGGMMGSGDDCTYIRNEASRVPRNGGDHYDYRSKLEGQLKRALGVPQIFGIPS